MSNSGKVSIVPTELVEFFDTKRNHKNAIVAVAGEELATGLLKHYFEVEATAATVTVLPGTPKLVGRRIKLDCWLLVQYTTDNILYQVEIKNWSANSWGGKQLMLSAPADEVSTYAIDSWNREWDAARQELRPSSGRNFKVKIDEDKFITRPATEKVLWPMRKPKEHKDTTIAPLLCMWETMHPMGKSEPLFPIPLSERYIKRIWQQANMKANIRPFTHLYVFSISAYLRILINMRVNMPNVEIEMPNTIERLRLLKHLFGHGIDGAQREDTSQQGTLI